MITAKLAMIKPIDKIGMMAVSRFVGSTKFDSMPGGGLAAGPLRSAAWICSGVGEEAVVTMEGNG